MPRPDVRLSPRTTTRGACSRLAACAAAALASALKRASTPMSSHCSARVRYASRAWDSMCERNVDTPEFAFDGHAVRLERTRHYRRHRAHWIKARDRAEGTRPG